MMSSLAQPSCIAVRMLELMKALNFEIRNSPDDPEIKLVSRRLHKFA